jgi:hypothetical protein
VTGFVCDSTEEMADAVARTPTLSPLDCRKDATRRFSAMAMVRGYESVYRSVLGGAGAQHTARATLA